MKSKALLVCVVVLLALLLGVALKFAFNRDEASAPAAQDDNSVRKMFEDEAPEELRQVLADFKTKNGADVILGVFSDCEECTSPEFLSVQTSTEVKLREIPAPKRVNYSEALGRTMTEKVIYGPCSNEILVLQQARVVDVIEGKEKGPVELVHVRTRAMIGPQGQITLIDEKIDQKKFDELMKEKIPAGCEFIQAEGAL